MTNPVPPGGLHLAVDAGGTSTRAVAVAADGTCVGVGRAGSGNPTSAGRSAAVSAIVAASAEALGSAGPARAAALAVAGHRGHVEAIVEGLSGLVSGEIHFEVDLLAAYYSATASPSGRALVSGTGAAAIRVAGGQIVAIADGLGWLLGDAGSGFWIGREVARAALAALEDRGPATALTGALLTRLGLGTGAGVGAGADTAGGRVVTLQDAVDAVYARPPLRLADHADLAFAAAGDPVAEAILDEAAAGLRQTLAAVRGDGAGDEPLVVGGSVLARQPAFAARVAPGAILAHDGLAGAAMLALRHGGIELSEALLTRVTTTLQGLRDQPI